MIPVQVLRLAHLDLDRAGNSADAVSYRAECRRSAGWFDGIQELCRTARVPCSCAPTHDLQTGNLSEEYGTRFSQLNFKDSVAIRETAQPIQELFA